MLSSSLTVEALIGWLVVAAILGVVLWFYVVARKSLRKLGERLEADKACLVSARAFMQRPQGSKTAKEVVKELLATLPKDCSVHRRLRVLITHQVRNPYAPMDRVALVESESARVQSGTDEARFWAGAFVFIGLIGTLTGLTIAVVHLMSVVGRAGSSAGYATSMKDLTRNMVATFSGMGGAFLSTSIGVVFTLVLSKQVSNYERQAETFRQELEEFSHLDLEPLVGMTKDTVAAEAPLQLAVQKMQYITEEFNKGLNAALESVRLLTVSTGESASGLQAAATTFQGAADNLSVSTGGLDWRLVKLGQVVERQESAQTVFIQNTQAALQWLDTAVKNADATFTRLDGYRDDIKKDNDATRALYQQLMERLTEDNRKSADDNQRVYHSIREAIEFGLARVNESIEKGVDQENQMVKSLRETLSHLEQYTAHVESTVRDHLVAMQAGPLIEFESNNEQMITGIVATLNKLGGEISGLKGSFGSVGQTMANVHSKLDSMDGSGRGRDDKLREEVVGMSNQLNGINARVALMTNTIGKLERSVIFSWGRRGQG